VRRQRNDGNGSGLWRTFELARRFPAVEHRQIQIHQNQVGTLGARHLDSLCAVDGEHHLKALARQPPRQHITIHLVVFNQEYLCHGLSR